MKKLLLLLVFAVACATVHADQKVRLPRMKVPASGLVGQANLTYVGGCRVPQGTYGTANFGYGGGGDNAIGGGIAFDPAGNSGAGSLFVSGNFRVADGGYQGSVAEIALCSSWVNSATLSSLQTAPTPLQNFSDITEGTIASLESSIDSNQGYIKLGAPAVFGTRVCGPIFHQYDSTNPLVLYTTHYCHSRTLSNHSSLEGFEIMISNSRARYASNWLTPVPSGWQAALGGDVLAGGGGLSTVSTTSHGWSAFAFNIASIAGAGGDTVTPYDLLYYDNSHETLGAWSATPPNAVYGATTMMPGCVIVGNTYLCWGTHSENYCYGPGTNDPAQHGVIDPVKSTFFAQCYDPTNPDNEGVHTYPNHFYMVAYNLADFAAVKAGTKQPYEPQPYAHWTITFPVDQDNKIAGGITINPTPVSANTYELYVSQFSGDVNGYGYPIIHKFTVTVP